MQAGPKTKPFSRFGEFGFALQPELQAANILVHIVSDGTRQEKVAFTRHGSDLLVKIAAPPTKATAQTDRGAA